MPPFHPAAPLRPASWPLALMPALQLLADELKLEKESLDSYVSSLKEAAGGDADMSADQVKALFAADGEAVDIDDEAEPEDDIAAILAAAEPTSTAAADDELAMGEVSTLEDSALGA